MSSDDDNDRHFDPFSNRRIMFAAIVFLFVIILLTIILLIYVRYKLRVQERRRPAILHRLGGPIPQDPGNSNKPLGLDPLVIASLPMMAYKSTDQLDHGGVPVECSVCLGTIAEDSTVRLLSNCKHMFHVECIDMWLGSHTTCPNCRAEAESRVRFEGIGTGSGVQPSAPFGEENMLLVGAPPEKAAASGSGS
uniref:RING-type E3 ubiquitin transferase n=1 Tax=Rhizophora mucronata TaxID=61149 RepID=A0A2P2KBT0_RHIMU